VSPEGRKVVIRQGFRFFFLIDRITVKQACIGCLWFTVALVFATLPLEVLAADAPEAGDTLIAMRLDTPETATARTYLGLKDDGTFDPTSITGRLLVIEIFSMYCPHCQREAPAVNKLFKAIEASPTLGGQVKMIGIGVGNSAFEVDHFRKHYQVEFPLFPDEAFSIHQALGEVRTPFFIIVAIGAADKGMILWTGAGKMEPLETFMERLNKLLKQR
jgi:peroxiredoxin